jgi:hypothetical protein
MNIFFITHTFSRKYNNRLQIQIFYLFSTLTIIRSSTTGGASMRPPRTPLCHGFYRLSRLVPDRRLQTSLCTFPGMRFNLFNLAHWCSDSGKLFLLSFIPSPQMLMYFKSIISSQSGSYLTYIPSSATLTAVNINATAGVSIGLTVNAGLASTPFLDFFLYC